MAAVEGLRFQRDPSGHRYLAFLDDAEVAYAEVDEIAADKLLIKHTEVLAAFERRGIGSAFVVHMLEDARRQGRGVIPIWPYTAAYIKRHSQYLDYVSESYRPVLAQP